VNRDHWPTWLRLANAAGRCLSQATRDRPPGVTRYQRLVLMSAKVAPRWLVAELAAEHSDRMAREEYAEVMVALAVGRST
jgi:hypothetical protein